MLTYQAAPSIDVISANITIPGFGQVPNNAFVLHGKEPILVDTGAGVQSEEFIRVLRTVIDVGALKWIWLTHPDPDHIGSLHALLRENPHLKVITTFLSVGILSTTAPLPMERVYLLNAGEKLQLEDRCLFAFKPPAFDNAATTGFFEENSGALFSSDCFGGLLAEPPQSVDDLSDQQLIEAQTLWATIDSPWLHKVDPALLQRELDQIRGMQPKMILSNHLPAAIGSHAVDRIIVALPGVPSAPPFIGPNQAALEQMLQQMMGASQA